ncbi:hypothetical protein [Streptomyces monashensis]|uniref:Transposase IS204/IS1001/IS1096/IS1165 zinc-finger domain-containing protein n=1 Tax=Streptomyces monashensis TaxID=1678012 RepID=A0A1S2PQT2_9ACTN|nr:hypothetical protein [Streptomyces monashensis]OIJ95284.1 hypothetical protein BIV23_34480 [Streptomyces monashensis]
MCDELLDIVFPHLKTVLVERVCVESGTVHVTARTPDNRTVDCPSCGMAAHRVHGRYQRHLADTAVPGRPVVIGYWCAVSSAISQHAGVVRSLSKSRA